jgi:phosphoribosyl-ATP pyrophosphohydrolase/phosphoribosyl-AMP cyclohydrolase
MSAAPPLVSPDALDFDKDGTGLVPAVAQDARTGEVLMLAWQNREAVAETLRTGEAVFWSRSRRELWRKGATSGNALKIQSIAIDCDADAVLLRVVPEGPACHTGERTCFHRGLLNAPPIEPLPMEILHALEATLEERRVRPPEGSYVAKLYADEAKRHKKVGEEATELVVASLRGTREEIVGEAADLLFHALVLLRTHGLGLADVAGRLAERVGAPRRE